jgi:Tfp pilus assembly protein PilF
VLGLTDRKNVQALIGLGKLFEPHDIDEAMRYYQEAMKVAPDDPEPIREYGRALVIQKKPDNAVQLYQDALMRFSKDAELYRLLGQAQRAKGDIEAAIGSLKKSVALAPFVPGTHIDLATCYFVRRDMASAGKEIDTAFKLDPMNYDLYMSVGEMYAVSNDLDKAYMCYRNASFLRKDAPEPQNNVGFILTKQSVNFWRNGQPQIAHDKIKEAEQRFQRAIDLKPDFQSAIKNLATARMVETQVLTRPSPTSRPATAPAK